MISIMPQFCEGLLTLFGYADFYCNREGTRMTWQFKGGGGSFEYSAVV